MYDLAKCGLVKKLQANMQTVSIMRTDNTGEVRFFFHFLFLLNGCVHEFYLEFVRGWSGSSILMDGSPIEYSTMENT